MAERKTGGRPKQFSIILSESEKALIKGWGYRFLPGNVSMAEIIRHLLFGHPDMKDYMRARAQQPSLTSIENVDSDSEGVKKKLKNSQDFS